jgi:LuxR family transcriptional regulator, maltose regulon positive regulatory protein
VSTPLLRTKLYIPPAQPGLVHRPRLTQLINDGLNRKLTLLSAPAGFGKTTCVIEWLLTSQRPVAWLSLEEADNDLTRFWTYFMAALEMLQERMVHNAQAFLLPAEGLQTNLYQLESFTTLLVNDISAFPHEFVFILDDFQHINNPLINEGMVFLIDHLPPGMHLIITCRTDPPLPLARLRARGQMTELRVDDLRFTSEEAVMLLNEIAKLNLSSEEIAALETRTEGWIAGLQLAAISMQRCADTTDFIKSFTGSHRFIMDYLVDEVLRSQADDIQSFLLETSILDRFTGPLCDTVTGRSSGQEILEQLEQANLFIIPLDDERRWYRYHHLFMDLLRSRLKGFEPEHITELHQRASKWFEQNGLLPEAVNHTLATENFERAAQLIESAAETQRQAGEIATLTGWINALPVSIRRSHPGLCLAYARALVDTAQDKVVEAILEDAAYGLENVLSPEDPAADFLRGQWAALTAHIEMSQQHFEQVIELSLRARQLLAESDTRWCSFVALNLAGAYRFTSRWAAADQTYLEASVLSQLSGDKVNTLVALSMRGEVFEAMGHLHRSVQQFEQVLQLAQTLEIPGAPVTGHALTGLARAWYEWNDLDAAIQYAQQGLECGKKADNMGILLRAYLVQARIKQAQGDLNAALELLEAVDPAVRRMGGSGVAEWVNAFRAQIWLAQGETGAAIGWASTYPGTLLDTVFPSIAIVLARVRLAQGRTDEALGLLEHALQSAHAIGREGNAVQILVVKALAHQAHGRHPDALSALAEALTLAEPEGYLRVFLDEGEPMQRLLSDVRLEVGSRKRAKTPDKHKLLLDYTARLMMLFPLATSPHPDHQSLGKHTSPHPDVLSERELVILRLLANGLSKRDIANRDVVSINTVKTQVKSIFEKLGVHTLQDAISAAKTFHLL